MIVCKNGVSWLYQLDHDASWTPEHPIKLDYDLECYDEKGNLWLVINKNGSLTVKAGYAWNGCTPKFGFFDILIGTPDGVVTKKTGKPKAYYATMIHDSLYQFLPDMPKDIPITRKLADAYFLEILKRDEFALRGIYWLAVRIFGGLAMRGRKQVTRKTTGRVELTQNTSTSGVKKQK